MISWKFPNNFINKFVQFSKIVLYVIATGMLVWLTLNAPIQGKIWLALLLLPILTAIASGLLERLFDRYKKAEMMVVTLVALFFWLVNLWWVYVVPYWIEGDQAVVWYNSVLNMQGEFPMYVEGGQIYIYPQHQGLCLLYEILFRITGSTSYQMIGYLNASLAPITLIFGYDCVKMSLGRAVAIRFLPLMILCLPYTIYAPYVYGDIPSIAFTFVLLWAVLKAMKTMKKRYYIMACLVGVIALFCRMNMWICFIGIVIALFYHCFHQKSFKPLILAVALVLSVSLGTTGLKAFNAVRSGEPVSKGMPTILWVAMGLQNGVCGPGFYNNYSKDVYREADFDRELASAIGKQEVKDRISVYWHDKVERKDFFSRKMKLQWEEPLFESMQHTSSFDTTAKREFWPMVESFYQGEGHAVIKRVSEYMLCIIYVFALIGVLGRLFSKGNTQKDTLLYDIPLIVFVGGFLFSIVWEAKARYMLPYYILLHMYAAYGLWVSSTQIKIILNKFLFRKQTTEV